MKRFLQLLCASIVLVAAVSCHGGGGTPVVPTLTNERPGGVRSLASTSDNYSAAVLGDKPTAYYRLDDTGTTASDLSGNNLTGTIGSLVTKGVAGLLAASSDTAMSFPGSATSASIVNVPQTALLQPANAVTLETWIKFSSTPANNTVIAGYGSDRIFAPYDLYFSSGKVVAQFALSSGVLTVSSPSALAINTAYYVVATYDGTTGRLYLNGSLVGSATKTGTFTNYYSGYGFSIGDDDGLSDPGYKGIVDEVAVYAGTALNATQIAHHYSAGTTGVLPTPTPTPPTTGYASVIAADGPSAYYRLDDTGTIAADSSGSGHNGTIGSSVTTGVPGLIAGTDTAMALPGIGNASGAIVVPQSAALQPSTNLSFEAWLRFASTPANYSVPFAYGSDAIYAPYDFYFYGGSITAQIDTTAGVVTARSPSALSANTTYHVAATYDGTTLRLYVDGALVASAAKTGTIAGYTSGYGLTMGDDAGFSDPPFKGTLDEVAVYAGKTLTAAQILNHYNTGTGSLASPSPVPDYSDWTTFGDNLQRTGYNANEKLLSPNSVGTSGLKMIWAANLGGPVTAEPVLATNVSINGASTNVLYVGTENNVFYAINADTGAILWKNASLGSPVKVSCADLPNDTFGITGTATYDKAAGLVYVADATDVVHALSMTTGAQQWSVNALYDPNTGMTVGSQTQDHIYGALTYNPANGMLYTYTGSFCDLPPWHGRIVAINTSTQAVTAAFFPGRSGAGKTGTAYCGGGIWGLGGASIDAASNDVFVTSGNMTVSASTGCIANANGETYPYGNAVIQLDQNLNLISYSVSTINGKATSNDSDYGATAMLYTVPGCSSEQLSAKNKDGYIYTFSASPGGIAVEQQLQLGQTTSGGDFVGVLAYDPSSGLAYVGDPKAVGTYAHGLIALAPSGCGGLSEVWQASIGTANATAQDNQAPTTANGLVFFTDGLDNQLWAFNDSNGAVVWHSGTTIGSPCASYGTSCGIFGAATVDGRAFVGSWNDNLYAFSL